MYTVTSGLLLATYVFFSALFSATHQWLFFEIAFSPILVAITYAVSDEALGRSFRLTLYCLLAVCLPVAIGEVQAVVCILMN